MTSANIFIKGGEAKVWLHMDHGGLQEWVLPKIQDLVTNNPKLWSRSQASVYGLATELIKHPDWNISLASYDYYVTDLTYVVEFLDDRCFVEVLESNTARWLNGITIPYDQESARKKLIADEVLSAMYTGRALRDKANNFHECMKELADDCVEAIMNIIKGEE